MKKVLLSAFAVAMSIGFANAQCTPNPAYAAEAFGLWPDSIPFLENNFACAGQDYNAVIDIKTLVDTMVAAPAPLTGMVAVKLDAFKIASLTGQPAGFNYAAAGPTYNATNGWQNTYGTPGNPATIQAVQGCLNITAAAAATTAAAPATGFTDYPINVAVDARIASTTPDLSVFIPNGSWLSSLSAFGIGPLPINDYVVRVYAASQCPTGVQELLNINKFDVAQNVPNPSSGETVITFTTPRNVGVDFKVYNMLGAVVDARNIKAERGVNDIKLNTAKMASGVYIYSLNNGEKTITKKMSVK